MDGLARKEAHADQDDMESSGTLFGPDLPCAPCAQLADRYQYQYSVVRCLRAGESRMQDQAARVARCGWPVPDATLAHMRVEAGDEFYSGNFLGIQQLCEFYRARWALGVLVLDALRYSRFDRRRADRSGAVLFIIALHSSPDPRQSRSVPS